MLYVLDNFSLNLLSTVDTERLQFTTLKPPTVREMLQAGESQAIGINERSRELMEETLDMLVPENSKKYVFPNFDNDEVLVGQRRSDGRGGWRMIWWWISRTNERMTSQPAK